MAGERKILLYIRYITMFSLTLYSRIELQVVIIYRGLAYQVELAMDTVLTTKVDANAIGATVLEPERPKFSPGASR